MWDRRKGFLHGLWEILATVFRAGMGGCIPLLQCPEYTSAGCISTPSEEAILLCLIPNLIKHSIFRVDEIS